MCREIDRVSERLVGGERVKEEFEEVLEALDEFLQGDLSSENMRETPPWMFGD